MHIIQAEEISLDYPIIGINYQSLKKKLLSQTTGGLFSEKERIPVVKALQAISFSLDQGDRVGLIGHNGAGKSTLLRVLAGIYTPSSGKLDVRGKIFPLLNSSLGTDPEATGLENIMMHGMLLGATQQEIEQHVDEIIDYTGLGKYIYMPIRTYSAGMAQRLAFATATALTADILLMDENVNVSDRAMMMSAEKRLSDFLDRSGVLLMSSHNQPLLQRFCNKGILLERGKLIQTGPIDEVFHLYNKTGGLSPDKAIPVPS